MLSKDYLSQLLNSYKEQKQSENLFIDTQSVHWKNYYKKNDKLWNVEISKKSFLQAGTHFILTKRHNMEGNISNELLMIKKLAKASKIQRMKRLNFIKTHIKRAIYQIIKLTLVFLFSKKILEKISKVLLNMSENK